MHLGHLIVLQSWSGNSQNFQQATFSFNGLDFVSENPKDELDDPGQFTNYTQFTWTLQNVPIANLTVLPFMIISSFPLAGQEIEFAALEEVDPVVADYQDLNCQINGQCASLQGSACTTLPECSAGEYLGRILLTLAGLTFFFFFPSVCSQLNGVWSTTSLTCQTTLYLNSVCFKISQTTGESWSPDST